MARFFRDEPDRLSSIIWSFVEDGTPAFPVEHRFASLNYGVEGSTDNELGEVIGASRPWRNGSRFGAGSGDHYCGDLHDFFDGCVMEPPYALPPDAAKHVACCTGEEPVQWLYVPPFQSSQRWTLIANGVLCVVTLALPGTYFDWSDPHTGAFGIWVWGPLEGDRDWMAWGMSAVLGTMPITVVPLSADPSVPTCRFIKTAGPGYPDGAEFLWVLTE